jgi:hypothetical protein
MSLASGDTLEGLARELDGALRREEALIARGEKLREKARAAKSTAAAPDYDGTAISEALWAVVELALAPDIAESERGPCPACHGPHDPPCLALPADARSGETT